MLRIVYGVDAPERSCYGLGQMLVEQDFHALNTEWRGKILFRLAGERLFRRAAASSSCGKALA
jgi:hypothetical protein